MIEEKVIAKYETLFIVDMTLGEEAMTALIDKFEKLIAENATVESVDKWGKRRLAYPINDLNEGFYTLIKFSGEPAFTTELERIFNITDGIMRSIVVKL